MSLFAGAPASAVARAPPLHRSSIVMAPGACRGGGVYASTPFRRRRQRPVPLLQLEGVDRRRGLLPPVSLPGQRPPGVALALRLPGCWRKWRTIFISVSPYFSRLDLSS